MIKSTLTKKAALQKLGSWDNWVVYYLCMAFDKSLSLYQSTVCTKQYTE